LLRRQGAAKERKRSFESLRTPAATNAACGVKGRLEKGGLEGAGKTENNVSVTIEKRGSILKLDVP
jgi:hypothetical protein